jgi:hypothetical protein
MDNLILRVWSISKEWKKKSISFSLESIKEYKEIKAMGGAMDILTGLLTTDSMKRTRIIMKPYIKEKKGLKIIK